MKKLLAAAAVSLMTLTAGNAVAQPGTLNGQAKEEYSARREKLRAAVKEAQDTRQDMRNSAKEQTKAAKQEAKDAKQEVKDTGKAMKDEAKQYKNMLE